MKNLRTDLNFENSSATVIENQLDIDPSFLEIQMSKKGNCLNKRQQLNRLILLLIFEIILFFAILNTVSAITERFEQLKQHYNDFKLI